MMKETVSIKQRLIKKELTYLTILLIDAVLGWYLIDTGLGIFVLIVTVLFVLPRLVLAKLLLNADGSIKTWKFGPFVFPYPLYFLFIRDPEKRRKLMPKLFKIGAFFTIFLIVGFSLAVIIQLIMELIQLFI